jgi:transcriptional regulator with XRE-family HTH domain
MTLTFDAAARERPLQRSPTRRRPFRQPPVNELGKRMREIRQHRHYSQTAAARLVDVAKQTISNWELGLAPPSLEHLCDFAAAMDVDVAELLCGLSEDLVPVEARRLSHGLAVANQLLPLYAALEDAGRTLMQLETEMPPEGYIASVEKYPKASVAFRVTGTAMEPRFAEGDIVIATPLTMAPVDSLVVASAGGRIVFRRFLPKVEGSVEGAILRALNPSHPDIEMQRGDQVLGLLAEHTSRRNR